MLKARIHAFECLDIPDFRTWSPRSPAEVYVPLTLHIGLDEDDGADLFDIVIATSQGLQAHSKRPERKVMIVREYRWPEIEARLTSWVESATGVSWAQIAEDLRKKFHWEFEGMADPFLRDPAP